MQTCLQCGSIFDSKVSGRRKFCSALCMTKWHATKAHAAEKAARALDGICPQCKKQFTRTRTSQVYCSHVCQLEHDNTKSRRPKSVKVCDYCGGEFLSAYPRQRLCPVCSHRSNRGRWRVSIPTRMAHVAAQHDLCWLCIRPLKAKDATVHHLDASGHRAKPNTAFDNLVAVQKECHTMFHRVHLVYRDGKWGIDGRIFDYLQIESAVVMQTDRNAGS